MMRIGLFVVSLLASASVVACGDGGGGGMMGSESPPPVWPQWGANPQHTGMLAGIAGQGVANKHADIVYDPFSDQEKAETQPLFGEAVLAVHEQAPITDGNDVYMVMKTGTYNSCNPVGAWAGVGAPVASPQCGPNTWNTMIWNEACFSWINGTLTQVWIWPSDWKPEPNGAYPSSGLLGLAAWEPVFHPAEANGFIYVPGANGAIWKLNKNDGSVKAQITPTFSGTNVAPADTFVSSPLTADAQGNIYYNVIALNMTGGSPWGQNDVAGAWLVKVTAGDAATMVSYSALIPGAPAGGSSACPGTFFNLNDRGASLPWPPSSTAIPPAQVCGSQRPGVNIAPAVSSDGSTVYTASVAHFDDMVAYVVAVNSADLTPKWATSLENLLEDGCGVILSIGPSNSSPNACRVGANGGVDPTTNAKGSGTISDESSSSPTVLPDGSVLFGATDNYNFGRGHLFHFSAEGQFINAYAFGWDSTPAAYTHDGTFSVVIKDNHYDATAYCPPSFNSAICAVRPQGPYYITQLDANLNVEWQFQNTTMDVAHPNGFEWCINMPAVDRNGNVYVNSEDGNIYELPQGHSGVFTTPTGQLFLNLALGAAYTPLSIGADGKLYTQNNGHLFVVGN